MGYIKSIEATNFKGRNFKVNLEPFTAIIGENMTGKTAVADAAIVALLNYHPRLGTQNPDTFLLCGHPSGAVEMNLATEFSDAPAQNQKWKLQSGKVKYTGPEGGKVPPVLLHIGEFLNLSGPQKIKYFFSLLDLQAIGFTPEQVTEKIKKGFSTEAGFKGERNEHTDDAIRRVEDEIAGIPFTKADEWLDGVCLAIKKAAEAAKKTYENAEGAIKSLAEMKAQLGVLVARAFDKARLEQVNKAIIEARATQMTLARQKSAADTAATVDTVALQNSINAKIEEIQNALNAKALAEEMLRDYDGRDLGNEVLKRDTERMAAIFTKIAENQAKITELKEKQTKMKSPEGLADLEKQAEQFNNQISELRENARQFQISTDTIEAQLKSAETAPCCPNCNFRLAGLTEDQIKDSRMKIEANRKALAEVEKGIASARHSADSVGDLIKAAKIIENDVNALRLEINRITNIIASDQREHSQIAQRRIQTLASMAQTAGAVVERLKGEKETLENRLRAATGMEVIPPSAAELKAADDAVAVLVKEQAQLIADQRAEIARQTNEKTVADADTAYIKAKAEHLVFNTALKSAQALREELTEKGFSYFLEKINAFTEGLMPAQDYKDETLCYYNGSQKVTLATYSGLEQLLTLAGLAVSLAQKAKHRIVILDEMGVLSDHSKAIAVELFQRLLSDGLVDQIICIEPHGHAYQGYHIIDTATFTA